MQSRLRHSSLGLVIGVPLGGGGGYVFDPSQEPRYISATATGETTIVVTWVDPADITADGIKIFVDGVENQTVAYGVHTATVTGLTAANSYLIAVNSYKGSSVSTGISTTATTFPAFTLYANFFGANNTFSDGDTIISPNYGVRNGTISIRDKGTGVLAMADKYMTGYGDGSSWTNHVLSADAITLEYGKIIRYSFISPSKITTFRAGLCKTDFSDTSSSLIEVYSATSGETYYIPYNSKFATRLDYAEYEFAFVIGGFDSNGNAYNGGSKTDYTYGYYLFVRSNILPFWFLAGFSTDNLGTSVVPYVSFYTTNTSPYEKLPVLKMIGYSNPTIDFIPTGIINLSSNNQFTGFNVNNTLLAWRNDIADGQEVNLYFCIDDYTNPTDGYRLNMARSTNTTYTLYRLDDGVETSLAVSQATAGGTRFEIFRFYKGTIWGLHNLSNFAGVDISTYSANTKAKIVDGVSSHIKNMAWYPFGASGEYRERLSIAEPFFVGDNAPGYGLPGETRKGHYFDVSSQSSAWGVESIGVIAYLINGSNKMTVKFRSHTEQRFIPELEVTLNLRYAYSGTDAIVYIASDCHFGAATQDAPLNYSVQIIPDITALGVTHCFILGDIVEDNAAYYADYIIAKGLYPSATWKELNGNHDIVADFKTQLGYADESHVEIIGNCAFIMCGSQGANIVIDHTFLGDSLTTYATSNCFIMSHAGRLNTTVDTVDHHADQDADIETAISGKKFVAWFAAHQHGWVENTRKVTTAKYLNLGDNN